MFDLQPQQWALAIVGAFLVGVAKTGIAGLGILTVAIYANFLPAKESTGIILPLLIFADVLAVWLYRRHAVWVHLWRLFPWVAVGVVAGYLVMGRVDDRQVRHMIGGILVVMVGLHIWRRRQSAEAVPHSWWLAGATGVAAGFTTMMANAAGPIMVLYWLALGLPKMEFLGTGAWYFLIINLFKVPFSYELGLITAESVGFNAKLVPAIVAGAFAGKWFVSRINQTWFEILALGLTLVAGVRLLR